jgi:hypothetical protein
MTTYEFTLITDRDPTNHADALFERAHGDLTPEGGAGPNLVHACIEADTLADAIINAIHHTEATGLAVTGLAADDLVSLRDIAGRLGRTYESVRLLATGQRGPGDFPTPLSTGQWSLYSWAEVSDWLGQEAGDYSREIAAADHLIRARHILATAANRADLGKLVNA